MININRISGDMHYWLIRTEGGIYYEEFRSKDFVAIGWNEFSDIEYLKKTPDELVINDIRRYRPNERRPRHAYNQIMRFVNQVQIGDIVIIPSRYSQYMSFGIVESDVYVENATNIEMDKCGFLKRRKVRWIKSIRRNRLDPSLYKLLFSHHTISNADDYADQIDRTLYSLFEKDGKIHVVLQVTTRSPI